MVYPNRTHAISEGEGTSLHIYDLIARYLIENLHALDTKGGRSKE